MMLCAPLLTPPTIHRTSVISLSSLKRNIYLLRGNLFLKEGRRMGASESLSSIVVSRLLFLIVNLRRLADLISYSCETCDTNWFLIILSPKENFSFWRTFFPSLFLLRGTSAVKLNMTMQKFFPSHVSRCCLPVFCHLETSKCKLRWVLGVLREDSKENNLSFSPFASCSIANSQDYDMLKGIKTDSKSK